MQCVHEYSLQQDSTPPHPLPAPHCLYILYFYTVKGGGGTVESERRLEWQQVTKLGQKY
jgi:hypothetical protein